MGLFKIKKNHPRSMERPPIFALKEVYDPYALEASYQRDYPVPPKPNFSVPELKKDKGWGTGLLFWVIGLSFGFGVFYWNQEKPWQKDSFSYVFFDVQSETEDGKKIPYAEIYMNGEELGQTDGSGRWQKYIKMHPKHKISLKLAKRYKGTYHTALKSISLRDVSGASADHDREMKIKFRLKPEVAPAEKIEEPKIASVPLDTPPKELLHLDQTAFNFHQTWISVLDAGDQNKRTDQLKRLLLPAIKELLSKEEIGFSPDSSWQITLRHIDGEHYSSPQLKEKSDGLILTDVILPNGEKTAFLRNYTGNIEKTAELILGGLKIHTPYPYHLTQKAPGLWNIPAKTPVFWSSPIPEKLVSLSGTMIHPKIEDKILSFSVPLGVEDKNLLFIPPVQPFGPPFAQWKSYRIAFEGEPKEGMILFAAGMLAKKEKNNEWSYWGVKEKKMAFSIIMGQKLIYRFFHTPSEDLGREVIALSKESHHLR